MSYDDSNELDRWHEYQEQKREAEEWEDYERAKNLQINEVLESMTTEEYSLIMELNAKLKEARANNCYGETLYKTAEEKTSIRMLYQTALDNFNEAAKKWPVLEDGF
jgi:hypothetical protein